MNMIRTTISLPENVHREWRIEAMKKNIGFGELILEKAGVKVKNSVDTKKQIEEDFKLFDLVGRSGKKIDLVKALREERDRDNA